MLKVNIHFILNIILRQILHGLYPQTWIYDQEQEYIKEGASPIWDLIFLMTSLIYIFYGTITPSYF